MSLINFDERKLRPPLLGCVAGDLNCLATGEEKATKTWQKLRGEWGGNSVKRLPKQTASHAG